VSWPPLDTVPKSIRSPTFVGPRIALWPIAEPRFAAHRVVCDRHRPEDSHARSARSCNRPSPQGDHLHVDRPHRLRRFRRRSGLGALAPVLLDPRLLGLRGEPARPEDVRKRHAGAGRRGLPVARRRDEGFRARPGARPLRARPSRVPRQFVLLDRRPGLRLPRRPHDLRGVLPTGPGGASTPTTASRWFARR
jgi:hypothetical protein